MTENIEYDIVRINGETMIRKYVKHHRFAGVQDRNTDSKYLYNVGSKEQKAHMNDIMFMHIKKQILKP